MLPAVRTGAALRSGGLLQPRQRGRSRSAGPAVAACPDRSIRLIVTFVPGGGIEPAGGTAAAFNQAIVTGITKWAAIVKDPGIKPE
ncbi:hypothetical protein CEY04_10645 [Achromobacter sp. HZ28]|nr:hypothetical protein CEY05_21335 [Achromobacter sp. HZ34]OWT79438.1 hypothetical protein CEY04_10645 [Achromobacter sp. HZ28]